MMRIGNLLVYDVLGAGAMIGVAALGVWLGVVRPSADNDRLATLRAHLSDTRTALQVASEELHAQSTRLEELRNNLEERGALPTRSPVEADLRVITRLARANDVELREVTPIGGKTYPGINELRYAVNAQSTFGGLVSFLSEFQEASIWADITHLKIGVAVESDRGSSAIRSAELVVSLLASQEVSDNQVAKR
jgi:hypothetical protein